ncbi:MAG TPA: isoleucine--tRNA ligase [Patescibacteria group bacterium]|nr:isoleucine--tRNA ligase [Patescibacteria group bacterium]
MTPKFEPVSPKVNFPELENDILKFWKDQEIFVRSVESRPENKRWTFLDGPPFITGMPHYGTLLVSIAKDLFGRYWTMKGYRVRRVWGWDCHGLPAENKVETKLGLQSKREIVEKVGVKKFIEECKLYVSEVSGEWEWYIDHIGRWVDFKHAYRTMDLDYMESVMWVFKQLYDKGYVYKGLRVSLYCPHCGTPISNFEVAMDADNHKEVPDAATTYKYPIKGQDQTFILAWSTTPWNKIVTPALAVNPELDYVKVQQNGEYYILAKSTLQILEGKYEIVEEMKGRDLVGLKFVPHYDYYPIEPGEKAFEVIPGDFVTAEEGTGVVTIAAYGEEDLKAMLEQRIHIEMHLDDEGMIKPDVPKFGGIYYLKANKAVNEDLASRNLIYRDEIVPHNVPLCWRCHTRLYYAPQNAWYVNIQTLKPLLKETNEKVNWFPQHFKYGRFLKSLENAPDWNISRSRYWGSPVPVWECECSERFVPGSIKELEEKSGRKINDLHKPEIDEVTVPCSKCGEDMHRVPEVLDSWIEAGSASFAERHFPFNKEWKLEDFFPPDFIVEYTGQIRAWFYVLHVIGGALYQSEAFKNVGVTGVLLGTDGRKMSKNYGNYPDPKEMLEKYGGDALRLYLMGSPVMHGEDLAISEEQYRNQVRGMMLILWNVYNFFIQNARIDGFEAKEDGQRKESKNVLDLWIESLLAGLIKEVTESLDNYDTVVAIDKIKVFIDNLSTWYLRRSRDRVGPAAKDTTDRDSFYETLYHVLVTVCQLTAPITPFIAEAIYKNLTGQESVHLSNWPTFGQSTINLDLQNQMESVRRIVEVGHAVRKEKSLRVRQPLAKAIISPGRDAVKFKDNLDYLIKAELNVKELKFVDDSEELTVEFDTTLTPELEAEGQAREIIRKIQDERKRMGTDPTARVSVTLEDWPDRFAEEIKNKTLTVSLAKGPFSVTLAQ